MKKFTYFFAVLTMLAICFSSCKKAEPIIGTTWECIVFGEVIDSHTYDLYITLSFENESQVIYTTCGYEPDYDCWYCNTGTFGTSPGSYTYKKSVVTVNVDNLPTMTGTVNGNTMTLNGQVFVKKQTE